MADCMAFARLSCSPDDLPDLFQCPAFEAGRNIGRGDLAVRIEPAGVQPGTDTAPDIRGQRIADNQRTDRIKVRNRGCYHIRQ